jgi:SAM-dependent methyltransferase
MSQDDSGLRRLLAGPALYNLFQILLGARAARLRWVRECLRPQPGARILDIGCGTAELLALLPADVDYTGFDMSAAYIEAARRRYGGRGRFTCQTVEAFTSAGETSGYDLAIAFGVLHHLDDGECRKLFQDARSALKPSGRLVTFDGAFLPGQSPVARYLAARDRGRNVRVPEAYAALAGGIFSNVGLHVWRNALRIPYDHAILECRP